MVDLECCGMLFCEINRQRRTVENKMYAGDERLEEAESLLKQARQVANEAETRYDEVCSSVLRFGDVARKESTRTI